jgi:HAE1 family hydrophobic/amphiphilic exporter-1
MRLSDLAIDRPITTIMFLVSLMILGLVAVFRLPMGFLPSIERPRVHVEVPFTGGHPLEILREIVEPLEDEVALVPGVLLIESEARVGSARVSAEFSLWDDMAVRRLELRDAVDRARPKLPEGIGDVTVRSGWGGDETEVVFQGRISAERDLSMEWDLIEQRITRRLERVPGVAQVEFDGIEPPRVRIDLDLEALRRHRIGGERVAAAVEAANRGLALGVIRGPALRFDVRDASRPTSGAEIASIPIPDTALRVGDVATVTYAPPRLSYARTLNRQPAIGFDVFKDSSANTVEVVDGLRAEIGRINEDPYLEGLRVLVFLDQGEQIRASLQGMIKSGIFGGLLATIVLFGFLRRLSVTLVLAVAIPFSLIVTSGMLYMLGMELNVLTLLGLMLGVGMLVDNAVVVVENIHRLEQKGHDRRHAARNGAGNVALAVTAATATTVLVWSWLLVSEPGELRTYMGSVAFTMSLSVVCSLIVSLTFIPLVAARYLPPKKSSPGPFQRLLIPLYARALRLTLRHRLASLAALLLLASTALLPFGTWDAIARGFGYEGKIWPYQRMEIKPDRSEPPLWVPISYQFREAMTLERMADVVDRVEESVEPLMSELHIENIYSFYTEERGWAVTRLYLEPAFASEQHATAVRNTVQPLLPEVPGVNLTTRERNFWRHRGGGNETRVMVAFHGSEPESVGVVASSVREFLEPLLDQATEIITPERGGRQEARIVVQPDRIRNAGTTPGAIAGAVGGAFRGRMLSRLHTPSGERDVFITVPDSEDLGFADLENVPIEIEGGSNVPLSALAGIEIATTPETVRRENQRVTSWLMAVFPNTITTPEAQALIGEKLAGYALPNGITWDFGERGRFRDDTLSTMGRGVLLSLIIVVLLLAAMFESVTQPLAIIITFPFAFFGGVWSIWFWSASLDLVGFMGVIILIGIVVNNGIVLVDHINLLRKRGRDRTEAVIQGCSDRLRPVLMTAITTVVGLAPLAFSTFTIANTLIDALAIVVMGGIAASTIFTLLMLPVWYTLLEDVGTAVRQSVAVPVRIGAGLLGRRPGASGG